MKKAVTFFCLCLWLLSSCNSDKVSDNDLSGKIFSAKFVADSTQKKEGEFGKLMELLVLGNAQIEFIFNEDHTVVQKFSMGMITQNEPYTWSLTGDSLKFTATLPKRGHSFLIKKVTKGVYHILESKGPTLELTVKAE